MYVCMYVYIYTYIPGGTVHSVFISAPNEDDKLF